MVFQKSRSRFSITHFRAKRGVAAIGSMAEPQQRRNVFLFFSIKTAMEFLIMRLPVSA
jgi:hypothetical protein